MSDGFTLNGFPDPSHDRMVARIRRTAIAEMGGADFADLDACVEGAVRRAGSGSVATFVPLLALREVRCCIRAGTCDCGSC